MIFDEVITGFRLGAGGAQARYDVAPDLTAFGKVIGGGLPIGAVGGRREVMENLSPLGPVFHAGTLSGNPIATAAGLAALDALDADVYIELMARARHLVGLLARRLCSRPGSTRPFPVVGTLLGMVCGEAGTVSDFDGAKRTDERAYARVLPCDARRGGGDGARVHTRRSSSGSATPTRCLLRSARLRTGPPPTARADLATLEP